MNQPNVEDAGWFIAGISTVIASLAAAVATLFKMIESKNTEAIGELKAHVIEVEKRLEESDRRHDDCQIDRAILSTEVALLKEYVARVSSMQDNQDPTP